MGISEKHWCMIETLKHYQIHVPEHVLTQREILILSNKLVKC